MKIKDAFGYKIKLRSRKYFFYMQGRKATIQSINQHKLFLVFDNGEGLVIEPAVVDNEDAMYTLLDFHTKS